MKNKNILLRALLTGMLCITSLTIFTGCIDKKDGDGMVNGRTADGELPENGDDEPVPIKANKAGKPEIKDSSTTEEPEQPEEPETTPKPEKKEETEEQKAEKSLEAFRQSMEGTLQNFGVAFLGEVDESYADRIPEWIEENFPDLSEKYPFVKMIPEERIIGNEIGQLFCVVPRSGDDPVEIIEQRMNFETFEMDEVGQLYSSETGEPYLVMCNGVGGYATAMISMGTEAGYQADWYPMMDVCVFLCLYMIEDTEVSLTAGVGAALLVFVLILVSNQFFRNRQEKMADSIVRYSENYLRSCIGDSIYNETESDELMDYGIGNITLKKVVNTEDITKIKVKVYASETYLPDRRNPYTKKVKRTLIMQRARYPERRREDGVFFMEKECPSCGANFVPDENHCCSFCGYSLKSDNAKWILVK